MSWVFLAGERAYKLKKPVRFSYLDFSTLARREAACRAELRRLAPDVYQDVTALVQSERGLALGGPGSVVDWLVVMRRLDETQTLEHAIMEHRLAFWHLDEVIATLLRFTVSVTTRVVRRLGGEARLATVWNSASTFICSNGCRLRAAAETMASMNTRKRSLNL